MINRKPASNLHHAIRIADKIGLSLSHFVTINFSETSCSPDEASHRFEKLRQSYFDPWIRRPSRYLNISGCAPTHVWVVEAAGGVTGVHWLIHLPKRRIEDFKKRIAQWVSAVTGGPISRETILVQPTATPKNLGRYILKGTDPLYAPFYGAKHVPQGEVVGKRSGYSRNLGPTQKRRMKEAGTYTVKPAPFALSRLARGVAA